MLARVENKITEIHDNINVAIDRVKSEKDKIKTFDKNHIFFDILKHLSKGIDTGEKIAMFYHFNYYQKALDEARNDNINMSKFWIDYVDQMDTKFSPKVKKGMDSLYYPMIAYYHFVDKKHDQAISDLKTSIMLLTEMEQAGIEVMLWAKTEQILNIGRTQLTHKDYPEMAKTISNLILFLAYGKPCEFLDNKTSKEILENENTVERLSTIDYVLDSTLGKILFSKKMEKSQKYKEAFSLLSPLWDYNGEVSPIIGFSESVSLLNNIKMGNNIEFLENLNNLLPNLIYVPKQFQYLIFEEFKRLCNDHLDIQNEDFEKKLNDYYQNELGLRLNEKRVNIDKSLEAVKSVIK